MQPLLKKGSGTQTLHDTKQTFLHILLRTIP